MIKRRNETKDFLLSISKNCETLIKQAHTGPQGTLEIKLSKPKETFLVNPSINFGMDPKFLVGLLCREIFTSIFKVTGQNTEFETYLFPESEIGGIL